MQNVVIGIRVSLHPRKALISTLLFPGDPCNDAVVSSVHCSSVHTQV